MPVHKFMAFDTFSSDCCGLCCCNAMQLCIGLMVANIMCIRVISKNTSNLTAYNNDFRIITRTLHYMLTGYRGCIAACEGQRFRHID